MNSEAFKLFHEEMKRIAEMEEVTDGFPVCSMDSLTRVEVIIAVQDCFNMDLTNDEILKIKTYGDLKETLNKKIQT